MMTLSPPRISRTASRAETILSVERDRAAAAMEGLNVMANEPRSDFSPTDGPARVAQLALKRDPDYRSTLCASGRQAVIVDVACVDFDASGGGRSLLAIDPVQAPSLPRYPGRGVYPAASLVLDGTRAANRWRRAVQVSSLNPCLSESRLLSVYSIIVIHSVTTKRYAWCRKKLVRD